ncbi:MAG: NfeD family protein [Candidatus Sumerlaeia bacterium]
MKKIAAFRGVVAWLIFCQTILLAAAFAYQQKPKEIPPRALEGPGDQYIVYKIELHEDIMSSAVPFFIHRAVEAAKAANADAIVLDLDTPGGRVDLMLQIRDELIDIKIPTYAYINNEAISAGSLLAVTTDKIVMSPVSQIGGAQVIAGMQEMPEKIERKMTSILKSGVRSTAKYKGHPVRICEAFVDSEIEIPGLVPKGEVLTMDQDEAVSVEGLVDPDDPTSSKTLAAFIAEDIETLLQQEEIWPAEILSYELSWSETMAKWLMRFKPLLLLIGLGALFLEVKTPGVGVPGAVGVIALALFFWGAYLADLANYLEMILFVLGFALLALEIFVIPGFGVAGVSGIALIITSLILAMFKLPPPDVPNLETNIPMLTRAIWTVVITFAALVPLIIIMAKMLPSAPIFRNLILNPDAVTASFEEDRLHQVGMNLRPRKADKELIGEIGKALTDLRPAGTAVVGDERLNVVTEGEYIDAGAKVRLIDIHGNVYTVESVQE